MLLPVSRPRSSSQAACPTAAASRRKRSSANFRCPRSALFPWTAIGKIFPRHLTRPGRSLVGMKTTPAICPVLRYQDGPAALDWLVRAFGFETHSDHRSPDGLVVHAELRFGPSAIGLGSVAASPPDSPWGSV